MTSYHAEPRLIVVDPDEASAYYVAALGAVVEQRETIDDGTVVHMLLKAGLATFTLAAEVPEWGLLAPTTVGGCPSLVRLEVDDAVGVGREMVEHGGEMVIPIEDRPYGRCEGRVRDPFGHLWIPTHAVVGSDGPAGGLRVRRVVADLPLADRDRLIAFYRDLVGLEVLMDQEWVVTLGSAERPLLQVTFLSTDRTAGKPPALSIEVNDLDGVYRRAVDGGHRVVHDRTSEPWGVERFFVEDPAGNIINFLRHAG